MRSLLLLLLLAPLALLAAAPASAGPACGSPDESLRFVPTDIWYGGGGCYGVVTRWDDPQNCTGALGPDRPYAQAQTDGCAAVILLQP